MGGVHDAMHKIVRPVWHPFKSLPPSVGGDASAPLSPSAASPIRFEDWSDDHYSFFLSRKGYDNLMRLVRQIYEKRWTMFDPKFTIRVCQELSVNMDHAKFMNIVRNHKKMSKFADTLEVQSRFACDGDKYMCFCKPSSLVQQEALTISPERSSSVSLLHRARITLLMAGLHFTSAWLRSHS